MPVVFNPFNPMSYVNAWTNTVNNAVLGAPRVAKGTPIPVEAKSANPGIKLKQKTMEDGSVEVSFAGTAKAAKVIKPTGLYAELMEPTRTNNTVSLKVALNEAVTTDSFGETNYTTPRRTSAACSSTRRKARRAASWRKTSPGASTSSARSARRSSRAPPPTPPR